MKSKTRDNTGNADGLMGEMYLDIDSISSCKKINYMIILNFRKWFVFIQAS